MDIIKHGGFKLSALQIESVLLEHPSLQECAVVGVPDPTYGEVSWQLKYRQAQGFAEPVSCIPHALGWTSLLCLML